MMKTLKSIKTVAVMTMLLVACTSEDVKDMIFSSEQFRLTVTNVSLAKDASSYKLDVVSNCEWDFTVTKDDNWPDLNIQKSEGGLSIQTEANTTRSERKGTITLTTKGGISRSVTISQTQGDIQLEVQGGSNKTLTYLYSGGKQELTIICNTTWTISGKSDWISINKEAGTGSDKVEVTVSEIQTDVPREATLVVTAEGSKTDYIIIQQQGKEIILSVSPKELSFAATGETKELQITCNADWTASASHDWVELSEHNGSQSKTITVTLKENKTINQLTPSVTISSGSKMSETINITQAAATPPAVGTLTLMGTPGRHEAILSFTVTSAFPVTASGLCYSETNTVPTPNDMCQPSGDNTQSVTLTGLEAGVTYYVRAYATSDIGTSFSNVVTIITSGSEPNEDDNPTPNPK